MTGMIGLAMGIIGNTVAAVWLPRLGVWVSFFGGSTMQLLALLGYTVWPIWWMNYYDCWSADGCPVRSNTTGTLECCCGSRAH